ncbi:MAG: efflux RND transporter periplasmic adaptor subunit [Anaerolineae bacterium]|nr:efflux RND transporter periplasmic adaptor subunit [Phycisphaerae bacterium]
MAEAVAKDVPLYIEEIGKAVAVEKVSIQPQASGQIIEIHFVDGADVRKGDLLFTIDPRPYEAALAAAKAALAQNQAALTLSRSEWERVKDMVNTNAISKEQYDQRQNAVAVAEAQAQAAQAAVDQAAVNLDYTRIRSPIDGRTGQRLVDLGNVVSASSMMSLLTIQRFHPIYADFNIPERNLDHVRSNMARNTLKTIVTANQKPNEQPREGQLTFLDNAVQEGTGTVKLRATLQNEDRFFWPGQLVQVRLVLQVLNNAVLVPSLAPQISQAGPYVYVVTPDSKAELRPVKLGQRQGDMIVISEGLKAGEQVVTVGQMMVTPGGPVTIMPPNSGAPGAPGAPANPPTSQPATAAN